MKHFNDSNKCRVFDLQTDPTFETLFFCLNIIETIKIYSF